jgi:hypothetical protein
VYHWERDAALRPSYEATCRAIEFGTVLRFVSPSARVELPSAFGYRRLVSHAHGLAQAVVPEERPAMASSSGLGFSA